MSYIEFVDSDGNASLLHFTVHGCPTYCGGAEIGGFRVARDLRLRLQGEHATETPIGDILASLVRIVRDTSGPKCFINFFDVASGHAYVLFSGIKDTITFTEDGCTWQYRVIKNVLNTNSGNVTQMGSLWCISGNEKYMKEDDEDDGTW